MSGLAIIICHIRLTNTHRLFYVLKVGTVQYSPTSKYSGAKLPSANRSFKSLLLHTRNTYIEKYVYTKVCQRGI